MSTVSLQAIPVNASYYKPVHQPTRYHPLTVILHPRTVSAHRLTNTQPDGQTHVNGYHGYDIQCILVHWLNCRGTICALVSGNSVSSMVASQMDQSLGADMPIPTRMLTNRGHYVSLPPVVLGLRVGGRGEEWPSVLQRYSILMRGSKGKIQIQNIYIGRDFCDCFDCSAHHCFSLNMCIQNVFTKCFTFTRL